ncbi:hypothetical protein HA466_0205140 [Hirschfeldia incana]|nr:hypothetical protein HA466_0205140 [Hirschfeldia incana]
MYIPLKNSPPRLKRNSNDVGWDYGVLCDARYPDEVKCLLCGKEFSGGIFRMKEHIGQLTGNVAACPRSTKGDQETCKKALAETKNKKSMKRKHEEALRAEVLWIRLRALLILKCQRLQRHNNRISMMLFQRRGHMLSTSIVLDGSISQIIHLMPLTMRHLGNPGWVPHTQYQLRETLLNEEKQRTIEKLKALEEEWDREGCSAMTDAWTDRKKRSIMNLCVNSRGGTCFLSSKDASKDARTGEYIFSYIDKCIEDLGAEKVVQVVTDNATNNVAAARLLKEKRPRIFWTGCAALTVDLMLEGISKLADIVRPGVTRFATCFLTLDSLYEKKAQLRNMFNSDEWHDCKHSKTAKGKLASETVMSCSFWNNVNTFLKVFSPMVKVLRLADGEEISSLGFIYGELLVAKNSIKEATDHLEKNYQPIFKIIDEKMKGRLDSPLNMPAYFLNPYYFYKDSSIQCDLEVIDGFIITPHLQKLATRIVALTSSSSGCERKWRSFEAVTVLVTYLQHCWRLACGACRRNDSDVSFVLTTQAPRVRDLYDDDFESEDEDIVDMEFEPDVFQEDPVFHDSSVVE